MAVDIWRRALPVLAGDSVTLSELAPADAPGLRDILTLDTVSRYFMPPPTSLAAVRRYIEWARRERRRRGAYLCFAIRRDRAVAGFFQLYRTTSASRTAELGFGLHPRYWGTGTFAESARLVCAFAFDTLGLQRLEARVVTENGRANRAMRKIGALAEGTLRQSFTKNGRRFDQTLWAILPGDVAAIRASSASRLGRRSADL